MAAETAAFLLVAAQMNAQVIAWLMQGALPVNQDLANLDALAASTQSVLHGLPTPDDAHTTQPLCKINTHIL